MVNLTRIYTRTGDDGSTALGDFSRTSKTDPRLVAYADTDESNSAIGVARLDAEGDHDAMLSRIQNDLFDLGADLCVPESEKDLGYPPLRITMKQAERLEREIDELNGELQPLRSFVLPGGHPAAAHLHLARTTARRAERLIVELGRQERVSEAVLAFINRLSDFLFVAGRWANFGGPGDQLWVPGRNL